MLESPIPKPITKHHKKLFPDTLIGQCLQIDCVVVVSTLWPTGVHKHLRGKEEGADNPSPTQASGGLSFSAATEGQKGRMRLGFMEYLQNQTSIKPLKAELCFHLPSISP